MNRLFVIALQNYGFFLIYANIFAKFNATGKAGGLVDAGAGKIIDRIGTTDIHLPVLHDFQSVGSGFC